MKTDRYTKAVLTVIAACLLVLTVQNLSLFPTLTANSDHQQASFTRYAAIPVNEDGSITVRLSPSEQLDVNINRITTSDKLNVNVKEVGGSYIFGAVPVEIED